MKRRRLPFVCVSFLAFVLLIAWLAFTVFFRELGNGRETQKSERNSGIEEETLEESKIRHEAQMRADVADLPALEAAKYINENSPGFHGLVLEKLNEALKDDQNSVEALLLRGMLLWSFKGDQKGAKRDFARAVETDPQSGEANQELARVLCAMGEYDSSIAAGKKAVELGYPDGHFIQHCAYMGKGEWEKSLEQLKKGLGHFPDSPARQSIPILESRIKEAAEEKYNLP